MRVRPPEPSEVPLVARVWFESWRDSHVHLLPAELVRLRTLPSFEARVARALDRTRVVGEPGAPVGMCMVKEDEIDQLFVSKEARGTGAAAALLADGESRIAARGASVAWLACAIGNTRAARFYERMGWHLTGTFIHHAETEDGMFELETWRYEKVLR
jgi:ribosomal protein S18 acetylase RimI-like enzyme